MARMGETYGGASNFFKGKDAVQGQPVLTIASIRTHEFDNGDVQRVLSFQEDERELGLNKTNWINIAYHVRGEDPDESDDDNWIGTRIQLYWDPTVSYAGKVVGGIRIKKPENAQAPPQAADNGQYWGEAIASRFGEYVKKTVPETTDKTLGGRIQRIGDKLGERGWPDLGTNPAKWPLACKDSAKACADELAAEIVAKPEEDDDSVPF